MNEKSSQASGSAPKLITVSFGGSPTRGAHDPHRNPHAVQEAEASEQRRRIVRAVAHSSAMEDLPLDAATLALFERYVDGLMTTAHMRQTVLQQCLTSGP